MENLQNPEAYLLSDAGVAKTNNFATIYPALNELLHDSEEQPSRNGGTREVLQFKTMIGSPQSRCVGVRNRNMNIFFLLAEAIWIWVGRSDVAFLDMFNSKMKNYSDDGVVFHAPYGFRLRFWGESTLYSESMPKHHLEASTDQISEALTMLQRNSDTRRVVMSIWNPDLDLNVVTKDVPCNDTVFLKVRNGELNMTIANRSNDLHWGLPTNVFQFSFLLEIMSELLGLKVGTQVHNSDSLHIYDSNPITKTMLASSTPNLYDFVEASSMDLFPKGEGQEIDSKLHSIDYLFHTIITGLSQIKSLEEAHEYLQWCRGGDIKNTYLNNIAFLLGVYRLYKMSPKQNSVRISIIQLILDWWDLENGQGQGVSLDYMLMAINFFAKRMKSAYDLKVKKTVLLGLKSAGVDTMKAVKLTQILGNF